METEPVIANNIDVSYETDDVNVSFKVEFGKGKEGYGFSSYERTNYNNPYDVEIYEIDNKKMYRLLAEEGPVVLKVTNVNVVSKKNKSNVRDSYNGYTITEYGITTVMDMNKEPVYDNSTSYTPSNDVERDGKPWIVKNYKTLKVDQNGEAMFQWSTAKALEKGVKPTPEQELMGVEERHENSGMVYITFQPIYTEEFHYNKEEEELTRGGNTRGLYRGLGGNEEVTRGLTRGLTRGITSSSAARVGYGSKAETKSKSVNAIPIPNSRYILPIRLRIIGETSNNIKCAKDLKSATRVEELQKNTGVMPDI